jgi:membrane AbrB-like protein
MRRAGATPRYRLAATLATAATGAAGFHLVGLPLPLLLGPMFACGLAGLLRLPMQGLPRVTASMRAVLGVAAGASITPALVDRLAAMALSLAFVPLFILSVGLAGYPYFRRICGFDHPTAFYSAMPGGLMDMLVFGQEAGGNARILSLVHATRVLAIVALMPVILSFGWGLRFETAPGESVGAIPVRELATLAVCGAAGWWLAVRIRLFGASVLGPMALTAAASLGGVVEHRPPAEILLAAQFFIGLGVGVKYAGVTLGELRRVIVAAIGYCLVLAAISLGFAEIVHVATGTRRVEALLAFAPGGQGEMALLALAAGADLAYVVTHHLTRLMLVIIGAPLAAQLGALARRPR